MYFVKALRCGYGHLCVSARELLLTKVFIKKQMNYDKKMQCKATLRLLSSVQII